MLEISPGNSLRCIALRCVALRWASHLFHSPTRHLFWYLISLLSPITLAFWLLLFALLFQNLFLFWCCLIRSGSRSLSSCLPDGFPSLLLLLLSPPWSDLKYPPPPLLLVAVAFVLSSLENYFRSLLLQLFAPTALDSPSFRAAPGRCAVPIYIRHRVSMFMIPKVALSPPERQTNCHLDQ
ncbi:uncharacterized protein BO72DRAFT_254452 [Aspergillus fijiensis CBS 313.89]|uniref:Uncharacterized protein n=1 Tax=Aspergillus fijiensis CBS 313.89 TaxID=1448319 RepID=A0A8G1RIG4_9EURO|nr:uncharacterized protein BO72DRAFT_254452 [Aspergillus fijiensis CBS 313.89]RAK72987.1 hypothetical protein BO72DRAFT_254452 [Aspergillus fijiensis CBS 313.89]